LILLGRGAGADGGRDSSAPRLLLMRNGNVVQGKILRSGDDFFVQLPGGQMFVPGTLVRLACVDLQEAYEHLRERAAAQSEAEAYITLAKWCATQKLFVEARRELATALELDPSKQSARDLMTRIDILARDAREAEDSRGAPRPEPARPKSDKNAESLAGLRPELSARFTRKIQPILTNNCAAAGCHGPRSDNGFRLQKVAHGASSNRLAAERNLASVLEFVDVDRPAGSRLLTVPRGNHGRGGKPVFSSATGNDQLAELKLWVQAVAREDSIRELKGRPVESAHVATKPRAGVENPFASADAEIGKRGSVRPDRVRQASAEQLDPFDPEAFNRARKSKVERR